MNGKTPSSCGMAYILQTFPHTVTAAMPNSKIRHVLNCKRGSLVTAHHNEILDGVADLAGKAFTPSHMRNDQLIFVGCALKRAKAKPDGSGVTTDRDGVLPPEVTEQKGDLLIRDVW